MVFGVRIRAALSSYFVIPAKAATSSSRRRPGSSSFLFSLRFDESFPLRHPSEGWDPFAFAFDFRR
jgi:hypothetical protein